MEFDDNDLPAVEKAMNAEWCNGFGFQFQKSGNDHEAQIVFAKVGELGKSDADEDEVTRLMCEIAPGSSCVEFLGRSFCKTPLRHYEKISSLFQLLIDTGKYWILPTGALGEQAFKPGDIFSRRAMELRTIDVLRRRVFRSDLDLRSWASYTTYCSQYKKHWNWTTPEGKTFCSSLRTALRLKPVADPQKAWFNWPGLEAVCKKYKLLHHSQWNAHELCLLQSGQSALTKNRMTGQKRDAPADIDVRNSHAEEDTGSADERVDCMICMDKEANTLVVPCMHRVVCAECSRGLKNTPDRSTCVRCRRPIERVFEDEV